MRIWATFINRKHDPKAAELVTAWDEFSIEENPEGYDADVAASVKACQPDVLHSATVEIIIPDSQVLEILNRKAVVYSGPIKEVNL